MFANRESLVEYVLDRLPEGYMLLPADIAWLEACGELLTGAPNKQSVTAATKAALEAHPRGHIDPFELLIDTGICDRTCEPLPG